jgi:predicted dehydrogenase
LKGGRHLYCEKPLARTVSEARIITDTARKMKAVTQLGTQIHAGSNYRRVVELVRGGVIGPIGEVHVWVNNSYGGKELPTTTPPVPEHLNWDLWLGPVEPRPYHPDFSHFHWRHWWAFGGGSLADFGCHYMDLPFWALGLGHPRAIEVVDGPAVHPESTPPWLVVRYEFPARGPQPPVLLTWYHGGRRPLLLSDEQYKKWGSGVLFIGEKGMLVADYGRRQLWPEEQFKEFTEPSRVIPDTIGHHKEWIEAIRGHGQTTCPFDYSGPLTETALLGNVAFRAGQRLEWDWKKLRATHCPEADAFVQHRYRKGWTI